MKTYPARYVSLALTRYVELTGRTAFDFWADWLKQTWRSAIDNSTRLTQVLGGDTLFHINNHQQIDLLLSPHYYALFKAWQINEAS
jgi:hypothetical protein